MNHKRKRPKHQRAGCLWCKPHKDERIAKTARGAAPMAVLTERPHRERLPWGDGFARFGRLVVDEGDLMVDDYAAPPPGPVPPENLA